MDVDSRRREWENKWTNGGFKRWQLADKNPDLFNFIHLLCPDRKDLGGVFFVPLCGKSLDLKYLYDEGFHVFGVEFCQKPVEEFFSENSIPHQITTESGFQIYSTPDNRLKIACGDFLDFRKNLLGDQVVKVVWDRGAFGVIEKENRRKYVSVIKSVLEGSDVKYLLRVWEFDDWFKSTPPLNCPKQMIEKLFQDDFDIEEVQRIDSSTAAAGFGSEAAAQIVYLMTNKKND